MAELFEELSEAIKRAKDLQAELSNFFGEVPEDERGDVFVTFLNTLDEANIEYDREIMQ